MVIKPSSSRPESSSGTIATMDNPPTHSRSTSGEMIAAGRGWTASVDGPVMLEETRRAGGPQADRASRPAPRVGRIEPVHGVHWAILHASVIARFDPLP